MSQEKIPKFLKERGFVWDEKSQAYVSPHQQKLFPESETLIKPEPQAVRKLSLALMGEPMSKQSVRSAIRGSKIIHFQPAKHTIRTKDYKFQIQAQLPNDFVMFQNEVHITKLHFIFGPLKKFSKVIMDKIKAGEIVYKTTKPDLADNLKKLVNDSMSEIVYKDDSIIVSEDNVKKYYGLGGCIIIEMEGT